MPPTDKTLVLNEGEKDRRERVILGAVAVVTPSPQAAPEPTVHLATLVVSANEATTVSVDGKIVGSGGYRDQIAPGPHVVRVTQQGKSPYRSTIDLRDGETRTLEVTLQDEAHGVVWPWVAGGVVLVAGAVVGGYFLFKPSDTTTPPPIGKSGGVTFSSFR